jgi:hypothetical protein
VQDKEAFVFSLDNTRVFRPLDNKKAIYHNEMIGPSFGGNSLGINSFSLNEPEVGMSIPNAKGTDNYFKIPVDSKGFNILTGDGKGRADIEMTFSVSQLLVYRVVI